MEVPVLLPKVFNYPFTYSNDSKKIKNLMHIIKKYDDAIHKHNILLKRYNRGTESDNGLGRHGVENTFLINNSEVWYMWSLVVGILPAMPWLIEYQKQQKIDKALTRMV